MPKALSQVNVFYCHSSSSLSPQISKGDFTALCFSVSASLELKLYYNSQPTDRLKASPHTSSLHKPETCFWEENRVPQRPQMAPKIKAHLLSGTSKQNWALSRWNTPACAGARTLYMSVATWLKNYTSPLGYLLSKALISISSSKQPHPSPPKNRQD